MRTGVGDPQQTVRAKRESPMPEATLDQRMTAIEEAVRELQDRMKTRETAPD